MFKRQNGSYRPMTWWMRELIRMKKQKTSVLSKTSAYHHLSIRITQTYRLSKAATTIAMSQKMAFTIRVGLCRETGPATRWIVIKRSYCLLKSSRRTPVEVWSQLEDLRMEAKVIKGCAKYTRKLMAYRIALQIRTWILQFSKMAVILQIKLQSSKLRMGLKTSSMVQHPASSVHQRVL